MSYFAAHANERKETRQLHTRFPKQLKKAVLSAVQFREYLSPYFSPSSERMRNEEIRRRSYDKRMQANKQRSRVNSRHSLIRYTSGS